MNLLAISALLSCFYFAPEEMAQDAIIVQKFNNKDYVCFSETYSRNLLQLRVDYVDIVEKNTKLEDLIKTQDDKIKLFVKLDVTRLAQLDLFAKESVEQQKMINTLTAWYRNPYLWILAGVVLGAGAVYLIEENK